MGKRKMNSRRRFLRSEKANASLKRGIYRGPFLLNHPRSNGFQRSPLRERLADLLMIHGSSWIMAYPLLGRKNSDVGKKGGTVVVS